MLFSFSVRFTIGCYESVVVPSTKSKNYTSMGEQIPVFGSSSVVRLGTDDFSGSLVRLLLLSVLYYLFSAVAAQEVLIWGAVCKSE